MQYCGENTGGRDTNCCSVWAYSTVLSSVVSAYLSETCGSIIWRRTAHSHPNATAEVIAPFQWNQTTFDFLFLFLYVLEYELPCYPTPSINWQSVRRPFFSQMMNGFTGFPSSLYIHLLLPGLNHNHLLEVSSKLPFLHYLMIWETQLVLPPVLGASLKLPYIDSFSQTSSYLSWVLNVFTLYWTLFPA